MTTPAETQTVHVIDSHTGGEPTRVVISGAPDLGQGSLLERRERFRTEFDEFRSAIVNEPRGSDVWIGGILCEPHHEGCDFGVIFFNNASYLGMCGHGTIGLVKTLEYLGRIQPGDVRIDTPVGVVTTRLLEDGRVAVQNVRSYRSRSGVKIDVEGVGEVVGDVAWGGNWFFLVKNSGEDLRLENVERLYQVTNAIKRALARGGITGEDGEEIDHIELFGPSTVAGCESRNFVLCPGGAYDRSPCGTGTSAKLACVAADGTLQPGDTLRQESIIGSVFEGSYQNTEGGIIPTIIGSAYVMADAKLVLQHDDPFCMGIRS